MAGQRGAGAHGHGGGHTGGLCSNLELSLFIGPACLATARITRRAILDGVDLEGII